MRLGLEINVDVMQQLDALKVQYIQLGKAPVV